MRAKAEEKEGLFDQVAREGGDKGAMCIVIAFVIVLAQDRLVGMLDITVHLGQRRAHDASWRVVRLCTSHRRVALQLQEPFRSADRNWSSSMF